MENRTFFNVHANLNFNSELCYQLIVRTVAVIQNFFIHPPEIRFTPQPIASVLLAYCQEVDLRFLAMIVSLNYIYIHNGVLDIKAFTCIGTVDRQSVKKFCRTVRFLMVKFFFFF